MPSRKRKKIVSGKPGELKNKRKERKQRERDRETFNFCSAPDDAHFERLRERLRAAAAARRATRPRAVPSPPLSPISPPAPPPGWFVPPRASTPVPPPLPPRGPSAAMVRPPPPQTLPRPRWAWPAPAPRGPPPAAWLRFPAPPPAVVHRTPPVVEPQVRIKYRKRKKEENGITVFVFAGRRKDPEAPGGGQPGQAQEEPQEEDQGHAGPAAAALSNLFLPKSPEPGQTHQGSQEDCCPST